jgi:hypothetical protein
MFERPKDLTVFDSESPEYSLANSIIQETMKIVTPDLLWFSFRAQDTEMTRDELDKLYQESQLKLYKQPRQIDGMFEISPIIRELAKLGISDIEQISLVLNYADCVAKLGEEPKSGDIFRMSYVNLGRPYKNTFYTVSTVLPTDLYNFMYMNLLVSAEQTAMAEVPEEIKTFLNLE